MADSRLSARLRDVRIMLVVVTAVCATAAGTWGYVAFFSDHLVMRRGPMQAALSPDGVWELKVYEVSPGEEHTGVILATLARADRQGVGERVVYRGLDASFSWSAGDALIVRERLMGREHRVRLTSPGPVAVVEPRWDERLWGVAAFMAFVPAVVILVVGGALAILVPQAVLRRRLLLSTTRQSDG